MSRLLRCSLAASAALTAFGASNIDPGFARSESALIGEIDWRIDGEHGAAINQYFCSGWLFGPQIGWIALGAGAPLDGVRYRNDSAGDFGVNVLPSGALRGYAYGANIGWIAFAENGQPRLDWTTGRLSGSAYAANAGWLPLESAGGLRIDRIAESPDRDQDGLPDAWEITRAGNVTVLEGGRDSDEDGLSDGEEYLAGTDPLDAADKLGPIWLTVVPGSQSKTVAWATKTGYVYLLEKAASLPSGSAWATVNESPVAGTGGVVSVPLPAAQSEETAFFRVRAFPPLTPLN